MNKKTKKFHCDIRDSKLSEEAEKRLGMIGLLMKKYAILRELKELDDKKKENPNENRK